MRTIPEDNMNHDGPINDDERAAYARLSAEMDPGRAVEERIVQALKDGGLLQRAEPVRRSRVTWWVGAAAACVLLFGGGVALGEYHGQRRVAQRMATAPGADALEAAMLVQQTGSAYVEAVARFAEVSASARDTAHLQQGREVAMSALEAAAAELHQAAPDDPFTTRLLDVMSTRPNPQSPAPAVRRIVY